MQSVLALSISAIACSRSARLAYSLRARCLQRVLCTRVLSRAFSARAHGRRRGEVGARASYQRMRIRPLMLEAAHACAHTRTQLRRLSRSQHQLRNARYEACMLFRDFIAVRCGPVF
eukprot:6173394-Pleurochrysis_carterae.AAC.2